MTTETIPFVDVELAWSRGRGTGESAVLRRLAPEAPWDEIGRTADDRYVVRGLHPQLAHEFAVAEVLEGGGLAPEPEWEIRRVAPMADAGRPERPAAPTGLAAAQEGPVVHLRWDPAPDGLAASYELRAGATWEDGRRVALGLPSAPYAWAWEAPGAVTLHLAAVDRHGRPSLEKASLSLVIAALGTHVLTGTSDEAAAGWTGTKTGVEVSGGDLALTEYDRPFGAWTAPFGSFAGVQFLARYAMSGTYETAVVNAGQLEGQRVAVAVAADQPDVALPFGALRCSVFGRRTRRDDTIVALGTRSWCARQSWRGSALLPADVLVEIDTSPTAGGAWDGWRRWAPGTYTFWRMRLRVTLTSDGFRRLKLTALKVRRDKLNRKWEGRIGLPGGGPVLVNYADAGFTAVPVVTATLEGATAFLGSKIVVTAATATQCNLEVFDGAGTSVAADLGWHAMGV